LIPPDPRKGAGGDLNFALPDGKQILLVTFLDTKNYEQSKAAKSVNGGQVQGVKGGVKPGQWGGVKVGQ
jgi:hypothetical protein